MSTPYTTTCSFSLKELFDLANFYSDQPGTCLLYSGSKNDSADRSFLTLFPDQVIEIKEDSRPWDTLKEKLQFQPQGENIPEWVGFLSYEMGATSDADVVMDMPKTGVPLAQFFRPQVVICYDHNTRLATIHNRSDRQIGFNELQKKPFNSRILSRSDTFQSYQEKILRVKELIHSGDIYQLNLSQAFILEKVQGVFDLFCELSHKNPAPFSAFINTGDMAIISSSPERFLKKVGCRLETRPIKGTIARGKDEAEDSLLKNVLLNSIKERAELLMITDLMRNDLSKISKAGSVVVDKLWHLEAYSNVYHLLSIIRSECKLKNSVEVIRSVFPGGSITGCPKLSAMKTIQELEGRGRGVYTGAIGYFTGNGDFDFNIAIRTLVQTKDSLEVQLGGGIVADSDAVKEWEETFHKGATIFSALGIEIE